MKNQIIKMLGTLLAGLSLAIAATTAYAFSEETTPVESSGEASSVLSCPFECKDAYRSTTRWQQVTTLMLVNQTDQNMQAVLYFLDGNENAIALAPGLQMSPLDLDEINVCATLWRGGFPVPPAGKVQVLIFKEIETISVEPSAGIYSWVKNVLGVFHKSTTEPFEQRTVTGLAKSECRVVPPGVATLQGIVDASGKPPFVDLILIEDTEDPVVPPK